MPLKQLSWSAVKRPWAKREVPLSDKDILNQLAGLTGLGWTVSFLGFLSTVVGYGNMFVARLATSPQSLLYLGTVFFVATLGLDRLTERLTEADE